MCHSSDFEDMIMRNRKDYSDVAAEILNPSPKVHGMTGQKNHYVGGFETLVNFRCSQEQKDSWREQASGKGLKLSAWIHQQLQRGLDDDC